MDDTDRRLLSCVTLLLLPVAVLPLAVVAARHRIVSIRRLVLPYIQ
jgi:hypothetical protein